MKINNSKSDYLLKLEKKNFFVRLKGKQNADQNRVKIVRRAS